MVEIKKIFLVLLTACSLYSQQINDIVTDRPDQTESPTVVPKGFLQIEMGGVFERSTRTIVYDDIPVFTRTIKFTNDTYSPEILIRYGLSKKIELRLSTEYIRNTTTVETTPPLISLQNPISIVYGFAPITIGTKIKLFEEKKIRPTTSLIFSLSIPFDTKYPYQTDYVSPSFRFTCQHTLSERFSLSYNLGGEWENNKGGSTSTGIYTLSLGVSLINNLLMYVESYGFLTQREKPDHRIDGGFAYLIRKNIQLDISGGYGITEISPDYFVAAGLSFRIPK